MNVIYEKIDISDEDASEIEVNGGSISVKIAKIKERSRKKAAYRARKSRQPLIFFAVGLIITSIPALVSLIHQNAAFVIAGILCPLFCLYALRRFRSLFLLRNEVDKFTQLNHAFSNEHMILDKSVTRLENARLELQRTHKRLKYANAQNRENLNSFREIRDNINKFNTESVGELQQLATKSKQVAAKWKDELYEHERVLLKTVFERYERGGSQVGMNIDEFKEFESQLPPSYRARFDRLGTFNKLSGGGSLLKYDDFQMTLNLFAEMATDDVDIEFEIKKTPNMHIEEREERKLVITKRFKGDNDDAIFKDMFEKKEDSKTLNDDDDIAHFFNHLALPQYIDVFKENGFKIIIELKQITNADLKEMGINMLKHRKDIRAAITEYFDEHNYNETLKSPIKSVDDALVIFFGISKYEHKRFQDLTDIDGDENYFRKTFAEQYGYHFITNEYKEKIWTKSDAEDWLLSKRDEILMPHGYIQYNAIIFCGASHGSTHAMICSNGEKLNLKDIRSKFASNVRKELVNMPKIFIFNCCRTEYEEEARAPTATTAVDYSVTITGTEGDEVFGPKLSRYVATAFSECMEQNVSKTIQKASKNAVKDRGGIKLRIQECDYDINDVIFKKKSDSRGSNAARMNRDTRQKSDKLYTFLKKIKMERFYGDFGSYGYKTVESLLGMNNNTLKDIGVKTYDDRQKILKAISDL